MSTTRTLSNGAAAAHHTYPKSFERCIPVTISDSSRFGCFFIAFIVAVKSGQYDDSYTPSIRMLFEDELVKEQTKPSKTKKIN